MKDMLRQYKVTLIVTSIIVLLPMLLGVFLWDQLPDQVATHFNAEGVADGYSSKTFAVFGLPLFILACQWICLLGSAADPKRRNINAKVLRMVLWVCPAVSIFCMVGVYAHALGYAVNMAMLGSLIVGVVFILIGNYLPKCRQSYTMGIKIPWTLADEENWNKTHRMAGPLWMIGGAAMILSALVPGAWTPVFITVMVITTGVPTLYSYLLAKKNGQV